MDRRRFLAGMAATAAAVPLSRLDRAVAGAAAGAAGGLAQSDAAAAVSRTVASGGAWCWFGDPRAVHFEGTYSRTYVGCITSAGQIKVVQYDHTTGTLTSSIVYTRGANDRALTVDDHCAPSIVIRPDRRVVLFWSGHSGPTMWYRRSAKPEDISAWEPVKQVPVNSPGTNGYTYPNLAQLSSEPTTLYLFFRGGNSNPTFTTTNGGDIWTAARTLVSVPGQRPYFKMASNGRDTLHFAFTDGHPRDVRTSIYYMYYQRGNLFRPGHQLIGPMGTPVAPAQAAKIYDATDNPLGKAWIHDIAVGPDDAPVLTYATFPTATDHRYRYACWNGARWYDRELCAAGDSISEDPAEPNYSGGITLDGDDPNVVLLSRQVGAVNEIERWTTADGGATWRIQAITSGSAETNVRPVSPRGLTGTGPMSVLWMAGRYPSYTRFQTRIAGT